MPVVLAAQLAFAGCADTPTAPVSEGPSLAFALSARGPAEAFDRADRLAVQVTSAGVVALDTVVAFSAGGSDVRVRIRLARDPGDGPSTVTAELRMGSAPLFRGSASGVTFSDASGPVEITLDPVIARIDGPGAMPTITTLGGTVQLNAAAVMASGDTVPGITLSYTALDGHIVTVTPQGVARGVIEGEGRVEIRGGGAVTTITVRVRAIVARVDVQPAGHTLPVGGTQQFSMTARDQAGNALVRTASWSSGNAAVVTVDNSGLATGVGIGSATIEALVEDVTGSTTVNVVAPTPAAPTNLVATPSGRTVRLSWTDNAANETAYEVRRMQPGVQQPVLVATLTPNTTLYGESPGPDLALTYFVAACNAAGCSQPATVSTQTVPHTPVGLDGFVSSFNGDYTLTWSDVSTTETHFIVEVNYDYDLAEPWSQLANVPANSTSFSSNFGFAELAFFRVLACNVAGCSAPSNLIFLYAYSFTPGGASSPAVPLRPRREPPTAQSQPRSRAMRAASTRFDASSLLIALDR